MSIAARLQVVRAQIAAAAVASGRDPASVKLIAVSKRHPASAIREAYAEGQRDFGENYVQELADKARELADLTDLRWHSIGHLQTNKAKVVSGLQATVHTVDSARLAQALAKASTLEAPLPVLLQVNVGGEEQKSGCSVDALPGLIDAVRALPALRLDGLMTIPPDDEDRTRAAFAALAALAKEHGLRELSMGMSADMGIAVAAGATMVRVGTAIFGERA